MLGSKHKINFLLVIWGKKYIKDFLEFNLSSLLAPGNIPAFCKKFDTRFTILTKIEHVKEFNNNSAFNMLKQLCPVEFVDIQDLIVLGNYSTTITFAYDRGIKKTGSEGLNTYFIFLVADYIMANGSGEGLIRLIEQGYSGICAGNFQIIKNEMDPFLKNKIDKKTKILALHPRELLQYAFKNLHPITTTCFYNQICTTNYLANRFYFPINGHLIGRFYLLHMICIKPETLSYQIGASCDYSFIPEMCPSGNVKIITDSDDYLVVEAQTSDHELNNINCGKYNLEKMAKSLAEWTTKQHRENATHSIYFHINDITSLDRQMETSIINKFFNSINKTLYKYPSQPYRNHPYWLHAERNFKEQNKILSEFQIYEYCDLTRTLSQNTRLMSLYYTIFGHQPNLRYWHPRRHEFNLLKKDFKNFVNHGLRGQTIVFYDSFSHYFMKFCTWSKQKLGIKHHYYLHQILENSDALKKIKTLNIQQCVFFKQAESNASLSSFLNLLEKYFPSNITIKIIVNNEFNQCMNVSYNFPTLVCCNIQTALGLNYQIKEIKFIKNTLTFIFSFFLDYIKRKLSNNKNGMAAFYILFTLPGILVTLLLNISAKILQFYGNHCTNVIITLKKNELIE